MASGWIAAVGWYFTSVNDQLTWGYAAITYIQCAAFWRLARTSIFAAPLYCIHVAALLLYLLATVLTLDGWCVAFAMNRLFEGALLYIIVCAIVRIQKLRAQKRALGWSAL